MLSKLRYRNTRSSGRTFMRRQQRYVRDLASPAEFYCDAVKRTSDPTGTIDIRKRFISMLDTRWRTVRGAVQKQVVDADVLGLKPDTVSPLAGPVKFQAWLDNLLKRVVVGDAAWMRVFMQAAYNRAIKRAMRLTQSDVVPKDQTETVNALSVMCLTELQGIAEAVSQRVMRAASNAWLHNEKPRDAFRDMDAAFAAVGKVRSSAMAEFLVVKSFNTATLDQFAAVGVERVGLIPESLRKPRLRKDAKLGANVGPGSRISREEVPSATTIRRIRKMQAQLEEDLPDEVDVVTAGDDLVCQECEDIEAEGPYTIDEARSLIPAHPRCRCAFAPVDEGILSAVFGTVKGWFNKLFGQDEWSEADHPREPAGAPEGGQFAGGAGSNEHIAKQVERWKAGGASNRQARIAENICRAQGFDAGRVSFVPRLPATVSGGVELGTPGGIANMRDGTVTMSAHMGDSQSRLGGTMAHEIMHQKFDAFARDPAHADYLTKAINNPEFARTDGVTDYSKEYWANVATGQAQPALAFHETLAEMARNDFNNAPNTAAPVWNTMYAKVNAYWKTKQ